MSEPDSKNIHQRLHAVMQEVDYVQKEKKQGMNYTIVSHDAVTAKVRPVLVKHGVIYYPISIHREQVGNRTETDIILRFANVDRPEDHIDVAGIGYGIDSQDKGPGKAVSYAVKYCLLKALGLETGDDPDTESVEHGPDPQRVKPTISEAQALDLQTLIKDTQTDTAAFCKFLHVETLADLPASEFARAVQALKAKKSKQREAA